VQQVEDRVLRIAEADAVELRIVESAHSSRSAPERKAKAFAADGSGRLRAHGTCICR
jgi:hypothetical protein